VTPGQISDVARRYLTPATRTIQIVEPGGAAQAAP
jgi:predicted Zn-dependent peptidase